MSLDLLLGLSPQHVTMTFVCLVGHDHALQFYGVDCSDELASNTGRGMYYGTPNPTRDPLTLALEVSIKRVICVAA